MSVMAPAPLASPSLLDGVAGFAAGVVLVGAPLLAWLWRWVR